MTLGELQQLTTNLLDKYGPDAEDMAVCVEYVDTYGGDYNATRTIPVKGLMTQDTEEVPAAMVLTLVD